MWARWAERNEDGSLVVTELIGNVDRLEY